MLEYEVPGPVRKLTPLALSLPAWLPAGVAVGMGVGVVAPGVGVGEVLVTLTKLA